jgi:hypothetical protein
LNITSLLLILFSPLSLPRTSTSGAAEITRFVEEEEQGGHLLDEVRRVIGVGRHREMRVAVARINRRYREVEAGAPGWQHEIHLVLGHQPLGETHRRLGIAGVVIFHDLDGNSLVEFLDHEAALLVDVIHPQLVGGQRRHGGALRVHAAERNHITDLDALRRIRRERQGRGRDNPDRRG